MPSNGVCYLPRVDVSFLSKMECEVRQRLALSACFHASYKPTLKGMLTPLTRPLTSTDANPGHSTNTNPAAVEPLASPSPRHHLCTVPSVCLVTVNSSSYETNTLFSPPWEPHTNAPVSTSLTGVPSPSLFGASKPPPALWPVRPPCFTLLAVLFPPDLFFVAEDGDWIRTHSLGSMSPTSGWGAAPEAFEAFPFAEGAGVVTCNNREQRGQGTRRVTSQLVHNLKKNYLMKQEKIRNFGFSSEFCLALDVRHIRSLTVIFVFSAQTKANKGTRGPRVRDILTHISTSRRRNICFPEAPPMLVREYRFAPFASHHISCHHEVFNHTRERPKRCVILLY